jgi:ABC-type Mn2+/Zn2+ transport system ATPase subunit
MLDEPFAGLDEKTAQYVLSIISQAATDATTMVIVDHTGRAKLALCESVHLEIESQADGNVLQRYG